MSELREGYYVPHSSHYPATLASGLFLLVLGFILQLNGEGLGKWLMPVGAALVIYVLFGWFGNVVAETQGGKFHAWEDRSFRWGMVWFIVSEVMFFAAFFGALFYVRNISAPELGQTGLLWPGYSGTWPTSGPAGKPFTPMAAWGIPALNTLILLSSGATVTWAHWGVLKNRRPQIIAGLAATVALGVAFLCFQAYEYHHAYSELGLTLGAGVYGATFFMLTGFHGLHVTIGAITLSAVLGRAIKGHFTPQEHFGFEGAAWYWHFVDVVWLMLFVFVYWL
ncbi:MFS transporter [Sulfurimicrobium lacus]|uniref:cytochrome-c oxidase n=1 Tax=Sulfurimicrobium lacus TaxID=2715678 RepID=A0A6F8VCU4_9PROT|nr:cytochrome c oxidase subunit 3 [Sulfurimicrobium lacus]BCB27494.1 MFS transporter [Sulfurimicrobium lacus]